MTQKQVLKSIVFNEIDFNFFCKVVHAFIDVHKENIIQVHKGMSIHYFLDTKAIVSPQNPNPTKKYTEFYAIIDYLELDTIEVNESTKNSHSIIA